MGSVPIVSERIRTQAQTAVSASELSGGWPDGSSYRPPCRRLMPYSRHPRTPKRESAVQSVVCRNPKSASYPFFGSKHKIRMAGYGETMSLPDATEQNRHKRFVLGRGPDVMGTAEAQLIVVEPDDTGNGIIPTHNRTFRPLLRRIEAEGFRCNVKSADRRANPIVATFPCHIGRREFEPVFSGIEQNDITFVTLVGRENTDDFPLARTDVVDFCACHARFRLTEAKSMQKKEGMTSSSILPQALANLHHQSSRSHALMQARLCFNR